MLLAGDQAAGYVQVLHAADFLYVKSLGLIPRYQRKGAGKQIMQGLMSEAKRLNLPIKLSVFTANSAAEKFYVSSGFRKLERDDWFQSMIWNGEKSGRGDVPAV
ncbi:MAG: hypothetical protein CMI16_15155 [Opitutaceae bacterium]|nr:hypothetical protein [Opitutaceae bacterium]